MSNTQPTAKQLTGLVQKSATVVKEADETITALRNANAQLKATIADATTKSAAVKEVSEPIVDLLIQTGILPVEKKAQAVKAMGDPVKVAKQLEQVLHTVKAANIGHPSDTMLADDDGDSAESADQRYLESISQG